MTSDPKSQDRVAASRKPILGRLRLSFAAGVFAVLLICLVSFWETRDAISNLPFINDRNKASELTKGQSTIVDLQPWEAARTLVALAVTAEEAQYAREAERLADHEVDQAFASALRQASTQHHVLTGEALKLSQRLKALQQLVKEDQVRVQSLTQSASRSASATGGTSSMILDNDLDVAKAQLGLDSDELTDAQQDLARAVGDQRNVIQQELAAHEATVHKYDAETGKTRQPAIVSVEGYGSLAKLLRAWVDERTRYKMIQQALRQAQDDAIALIARHNQLETESSATVPVGGKSSSPSETNLASGMAADKAAAIASLNNRAVQHQLLSIYDDRIQTQQQLATVYDKWSAQLLLQHRAVLHLLLRSLALIASIPFCVVLFDGLLLRLTERPGLDRRRMYTLRIVFKLAIQGASIVLILLIAFGMPTQMPAIIGLTTAGITVVLQDFILAFLGWFVLMGRNGIRVGDWVEINGIGGEVLETGVFRTVMLETGNWTDRGHPTGRRITLMNSFAIKGQYFNFSTTGQWMWDEITLTVPPAEDTYRTIELIHKVVLAETENDARLAEQEWKRVAWQKGVGQFTAASSVDMRPGIYGIDLIVRYVTPASERLAVRNRLYQRVIDVLHKVPKQQTPANQRSAAQPFSVEQEQTARSSLPVQDVPH